MKFLHSYSTQLTKQALNGVNALVQHTQQTDFNRAPWISALIQYTLPTVITKRAPGRNNAPVQYIQQTDYITVLNERLSPHDVTQRPYHTQHLTHERTERASTTAAYFLSACSSDWKSVCVRFISDVIRDRNSSKLPSSSGSS